MSAFKKIHKQDAYITTYTAHKPWAVSSGSFEEYGITTYVATGVYTSSLQQLYYPVKSADNVTSHSFDYYNQTTLHFSESRNLQNNPLVISIPKQLYGTHIEQNSSVTIELGNTGYVADKYWIEGYEEAVDRIVDDGEGNLYLSGSSPKEYVGDIIYPHGIVIITNQAYNTKPVKQVRFNSSYPIYTHNYHCRLRESEFNFTTNPSALTGSLRTTYNNQGTIHATDVAVTDGVLNDNVTGSAFQPYITTVGLYNDTNELIAVGKMGGPIPKSPDTEMTILIKLDI
jgi:hypothetical protein